MALSGVAYRRQVLPVQPMRQALMWIVEWRAGRITGQVNVWLDPPRADGTLGVGDSFEVDFDPTDPSVVLAIQLGDDTSNVPRARTGEWRDAAV